ncbi:hypothetical protein [Bifidobacterium simiarum]|uniref:Uncharacterized protein n=1 Tax=Bifidobacterium simiarum TaxID=2045441 RepID=A0A2M9HDR6_9BIFI|nr:hypothetical protein [Bifidobacterium simiarum]PJM74955.1 hypothetical protein CSQ87_06895 [Bifidobacterium simiarum]
MATSQWKRPSADDRTRRLSDEWYPGEWLEPVEPDIIGPFLERYISGMSRRMAAYLRAQGVPDDGTVASGGVSSDDNGIGGGIVRHPYDVTFLNLCLIIDQEHTFPIGERNLSDGVYEPDEETAMETGLMLHLEFDRFVDFIAGLDPRLDRRGFVAALSGAYGYEGDIDSADFLAVLAARTAKRMASERLRAWAGASVLGDDDSVVRNASDGGSADAWDRVAQARLMSWGFTNDDPTSPPHDGSANPVAALERARDHWMRCVADSRRHIPRARRDVETWCVWHTVLETVWRADEAAYDARWADVPRPERDPQRFDEARSAVETIGPSALDGAAWNTLLRRMMTVHRRVSRGYAQWCDMMPDERDTAMILLSVRAIADDPVFLERVLAAACNTLTRGDRETPSDARGAMRMLLAYACVGRVVNMGASSDAGADADGPGTGAMKTDGDGAVGEYTYVGLRNAILGYAGYGGVRRTLAPDEYRDYLALVSSGSPSGRPRSSSDASESGRRAVWVFPGMADRYDSVRGEMSARIREAMAAGLDMSESFSGGSDIPESWWRFHAVADKAVSRWLGGETVHALAVDGHGHALAYRSTNPVAAYQDVNAWRLGEALERYEGSVVWGSGRRLADLYRDRGHLSKSGGKAIDRSIRDYAASARGAFDAVQYLAAVTGLGMMLTKTETVEVFARLIDACDKGGGERFRKSCWTLIRIAKAKRLRLTVTGAHGRHVGARLMELVLSDPERLAEAEREFKIANLRRALETGTDSLTVEEMDWRGLARMVDSAEHMVRDTVLSAFARLRVADRRWAAIRIGPIDCVGSLIDPESDGVCVFHASNDGNGGDGANGKEE